MDKKEIMFELIREGQNKFSLTKLPQRLPNNEGKYVYIDTNGKSCKSGYITAYFEDPKRDVMYIGSKLRYEKVVHGISRAFNNHHRKSCWYLLYYDFKCRGVDKTNLDIIWCFSGYNSKDVGEKSFLEMLDGLWEDMRQTARNYKVRKYNASRI